MVYTVPKVLTRDEPNYPDEYRRITGKATDAMFGFVSDGLLLMVNDLIVNCVGYNSAKTIIYKGWLQNTLPETINPGQKKGKLRKS
jgi:hypothetical protein